MRLTLELINAAQPGNGSWTAAQMSVVGLKYPLEPGWKERLIGEEISEDKYAQFIIRSTHTVKFLKLQKRSAIHVKKANRGRADSGSDRLLDGSSEPLKSQEALRDFTIYSDGGCWPNPGPGGWGFVCVETKAECCGGEPETTNNRMEISAALAAMRHHRKIHGADKSLRIISDSEYVVKACSSWLKKWKSKGWSRKKDPLKNVDLWRQIDEEMTGLSVSFQWVRGHNGNEYNEIADRLAEQGARVGSMNNDVDREFAAMF